MCDVAKKFEEWGEWLCGGDVHSIQQQIFRMMWNAAVFNLIRKARELALEDGKGEVQHNWAISQFILTAYFETQSITIRRLLDKGSPRGNKNREVYSLWRLLTDIENNCDLLTRENILTNTGCPYDYESALSELHQRDISGPELARISFSEEMHGRIDSLTATGASSRKPDDTVKPEAIEILTRRLSQCQEMCDYVNKFVAHPATPESRRKKKADDIRITLGKISEAHRILCQTAAFIATNVLGEHFDHFVVESARDVFENLTIPFASEEVLAQLHEEWDTYKCNAEKWAHWNWQAELCG
ncbi:MAG: hypothetical protein A2Y77_07460 [Planctomycetes bacterium RBG_13_62_9]|nr:MAG: hypothetical protein A2Y77_07460 [Planctomycetes bacterium RBG_13_62_9]